MACGGVGEYRTRIGNFRNYNMRVAGFTTSSINQNESAPGGGVGVTKNKLNLKHIVGGGYLGYSILQILGNLNELMNEDELKAKIIDYLRGLKNDTTYSILLAIRWIDTDGFVKGISTGKSLKITKNVSAHLLSRKFELDLISASSRYELDEECEVLLMSKEWLPFEDFKCNIDEITKTMNEVLSNNDKEREKDDIVKKRLNMNKLNPYNNIIMNNYGEKIMETDGKDINKNRSIYKINDYEALEVNLMKDVKGNEYNEVIVKELIDGQISSKDQNITVQLGDEAIIKWCDFKQEDGGFLRVIDKLKLYYDNKDNIYLVEGEYSAPDFPVNSIDFLYDDKIGTIDFETFGKEGVGNQEVYAGGWATAEYTKLFYIKGEDGVLENSENVVKRTIESIFEYPELNGYTFYAHNLGRFDSVFLIKSALLLENITIKPVWKDNTIISISIKNTKLNRKIKIYDSLQLINDNLRNILNTFNCDIKKEYFPYDFVTNDRLFYVGSKPDLCYFNDMGIDIYNDLPNVWDLKKETLSYLESDIKGLLEALHKFGREIFNEYSLNITNFRTLPSLALAIYTSNYYNEKNNIKLIKGKVEKDIRDSYFGGNVDVYYNEINEGYLYDLNSQYPKAMLKDMPIGNPIFTTERNLDNLFGFVYGTITAPNDDVLKVPFIQYRDPRNGTVSCPRGKFDRMIFTEEMKYAIKYGYSIDIKYGYKFNRGKDIFKEYVEKHYEIKKNASDPVKRKLSKLLLNSLYGKFGQREIESKLKIVNGKDAANIKRNYNYSIFSYLNNDKVLVKYSSRINEKLRLLLKEQEVNNTKGSAIKMNEIGLGKQRGVPSAVQIASAISSYARMIINDYKNITNNPCVMSDTDSVVLTKKLDDKYIGAELGQMKLEHEIKHGIFIRKKLYAIKTSSDKIVIKASGANNKNLTFDNFKQLLNGNNVIIKRKTFNVNWKTLEVVIVEGSLTLQGLKHPPIRLDNSDSQKGLSDLAGGGAFIGGATSMAISYPKAYPLIVYYKDSNLKLKIKDTAPHPYPARDALMLKQEEGELDKCESENVVIYLPAPTEFSKELSNFERQFIMYNLLGKGTKDRNILQANRILSNIIKILNQLKQLKTVNYDRNFKFYNEKLAKYVKVESKLFYRYGDEGKDVLNQLIKYLNSLDFVDVYFLLHGTDGDNFLDRIEKYITKINQNKKISYRFYFEELNFNLTIKNLTLTNNMNKEDNLTIKHEVDIEISKLRDIADPAEESSIKVIKHTWRTKFKVKLSPATSAPIADQEMDQDNIKLMPENFICVSNKGEDYMRDYTRWGIMLALSNI